MNAAPNDVLIPRPKKERVKAGVIRNCKIAITVAMLESVTMNLWADANGMQGTWGTVVGVVASVTPPLLIVLVSHIFAELKFHWVVKAFMALTVGGLMYVSSSAGVKAMQGTKGFGPALALALAVDGIASLTLLVLMEAAEREAAWQEYEAAERDAAEAAARAAAAAAQQAELDYLQSTFGHRDAPRGNAGKNAEGNAPRERERLPEGNAVAGAEGNAALPAGSRPALAPPARPVPAAAGESRGTAGVPAGQGSGGATVTDLRAHRAPATGGSGRGMSPEEIYVLAWNLCVDLAKIKQELSNSAWKQAGYGGKTERVSPIIQEVKADFAAARAEAEAAGKPVEKITLADRARMTAGAR